MVKRWRRPRPLSAAARLFRRLFLDSRPLLSLVLLGCALQPAGHASLLQRDIASLSHDRWTMADGLPYPGGYDLALDEAGYLWMGTLTGLVRFDGQRFVAFDAGNTPGLRNNIIRGLSRDGQGRLWIGTQQGVVYYRSGRFHPYPSAGASETAVLGADRDGAMFLTNGDALLRVRPDLTLERVVTLSGINAVASDGQTLWLGTVDGLYRFQAGQVQREPLPAAGTVNVMRLLASSGRIVAGTTAGLFMGNTGHWRQPDDPGLHQRILAVTGDAQGNLWASIEQALYRLEGDRVVERVSVAGDMEVVRSMLLDPLGNLWAASYGHGLHRFWNGTSTAIPLHLPPESPHYLWAVAAWRDRIYAAGSFGLAHIDRMTMQPLPGLGSLPETYSLQADGDQLWLGTLSGALRYDGKHIQRLPVLAPLQDTTVTGFLREGPDRLLIGTLRGLYRLEGNSRLRRLTGTDNSKRDEVRTLLRTDQGHVYVGGAQGLWQLQGDRLVAETLPDAGVGIITLLQLPDGSLLAGAFGRSLLYLHDGRRWQRLQRGLPPNEPYALVHDGQGGTLVSGMRGAYLLPAEEIAKARRDPDSELQPRPLLTVNRRDAPGQQSLCCMGGGSGRGMLHAGHFWLPASRAVHRIDTAQSQDQPATRLVIERVRDQQKAHPVDAGPLVLPASARDLRVEFSALNLSPLRIPRLHYRLWGYDRQWHTLGHGDPPQATHTNLPAGQYRFEVRDGPAPSRSTATLDLSIAPHLHETGTFRALLALSLGLLCIAAVRWNDRRQRRQQQRLAALVAERTDALSQANQRLNLQACTDPLTGTSNRRFLMQHMQERLRQFMDQPRHGTGHRHVLLFVLIDIDHFKSINDSHGHEAGDLVLVEFARRLQALSRAGDVLARWGGEEFLLVHANVPAGRHGEIAERLCQAIAGTPFVLPGGQPLRVTASIGMAQACPGTCTGHWRWSDYVDLADRAMYVVKNNGRAGWAIYHADASAADAGLCEASPSQWLSAGQLVLEAGPDSGRNLT